MQSRNKTILLEWIQTTWGKTKRNWKAVAKVRHLRRNHRKNPRLRNRTQLRPAPLIKSSLTLMTLFIKTLFFLDRIFKNTGL